MIIKCWKKLVRLRRISWTPTYTQLHRRAYVIKILHSRHSDQLDVSLLKHAENACFDYAITSETNNNKKM